MQFFRNQAKPLCNLFTLVLLTLSIYTPAAHAGMIGTESLVHAEHERSRVEAFLARDDVRQMLIEQGVDPSQAQSRIDNLTDAEVRMLAARIDQMPAGGDLLGAAVFVFLVLLVTDILGFTDIFPFVTKTVDLKDK